MHRTCGELHTLYATSTIPIHNEIFIFHIVVIHLSLAVGNMQPIIEQVLARERHATNTKQNDHVVLFAILFYTDRVALYLCLLLRLSLSLLEVYPDTKLFS